MEKGERLAFKLAKNRWKILEVESVGETIKCGKYTLDRDLNIIPKRTKLPIKGEIVTEAIEQDIERSQIARYLAKVLTGCAIHKVELETVREIERFVREKMKPDARRE